MVSKLANKSLNHIEKFVKQKTKKKRNPHIHMHKGGECLSSDGRAHIQHQLRINQIQID